MGGRRLCFGLARVGVLLVGWLLVGCEEAPAPPERIEIAAIHRSCEEGEACGVVETSCRSQGCECGVAVNEAYLLEYQKKLADCRGQNQVATCDSQCETPFGKCFRGACVLTGEPPELFRRGQSVQALCERARGRYVGCPECPPNEQCRSCVPCECPTSHRWTGNGCRAVVQTEPRDLRVETRPPVVALGDVVKTRVHNDSKRKVWLKTVCGTPFYRMRKKADEWEKGYDPFLETGCRVGSVEVAPGSSRPFVIKNLKRFKATSGEAVTPGSYRFEVTYTDGNKSFQHYGVVYSTQFDLMPGAQGARQAVR